MKKLNIYRFNLPWVDIEAESEEEAQRKFLEWLENHNDVKDMLSEADIYE